jgi:sulfite reductase (NADPH) hemoprotein beta-component
MTLNTPRKTVKSPVTSAVIVQPPPAREEIHPMSSPAKPKPATAPMVFTANRLRDGRVVWLAEAGGSSIAWAESVTEARVFPPAEAAAGQALAQQGERAQQVVGAYGIEVALQSGRPVPVKFRERLRAQGPSVDAEPPAYRLAS